MKKLRIAIICGLLLLPLYSSGCLPGLSLVDATPEPEATEEPETTEEPNQPPNAYIDSISPSVSTVGDLITFTGHGTDTDGTVVSYRWESSIDGELSPEASFDTAALSEGDHLIYFQVQDDSDAWSEDAVEIIRVSAATAEPDELEILYFEADPDVFLSGESSTLSWATTGATEVSIDQGIGEVSSEGTHDVSFFGEQVVSYMLTASNATDTVTASVEVQSYLIMEMPNSYEITLSALIDESGYVRSNGQVTPNWIYAGDDNNDIPLQGFFSFNINGLPEDAMISSVVLDLSDHDTFLGDPFGDLDCLKVFIDDYETLDSTDYTSPFFKLLGNVATYCAEGELIAEDNEAVADALQDRVGESRLQFRLQFQATPTNNDDGNDIVRWTSTHLPKITIYFYSYLDMI
jgi:hypothetical protein